MARELVIECDAWQARIVEPEIEAPLALCQSDHLPLSEPAQAVKEILLELVAEIPGSLPKPKAKSSQAVAEAEPRSG
jgi:LysR family nitrogen assimilation transcriptional regulator